MSKPCERSWLGWRARPLWSALLLLMMSPMIAGCATAPEPQYLTPSQRQVACGPCPFLGADTRCMIYPVRPLKCRGYSVSLAPDDYCQRPLRAGETEAQRDVLAVDTRASVRFQEIYRHWWLRAKKHGLTTRYFAPWIVLQLWDADGAAATAARNRTALGAAKRGSLAYVPPVPTAAIAAVTGPGS